MDGGLTGPRWWQTRAFVILVAIVTAIPLMLPDVAPLVDLPGHMARYRVQLSHGSVPWLNDWYNFDWQLIGNLGVDLLIIPLEKLFGLELAVKLIVLAIPTLTAVGFLWIAREVHGRIPATALFALPLAYSYPFQFGFVNFALSMALALNAFALWLRLGRMGRFRFRAALFVPIGFLLWLCHTFGWGVLGVLAFSAELIREHDKRKGWFLPWIHAGLHCLPLAPPALLMVLWRSGGHATGTTGDWFNVRQKINWLTMVLRDRWTLFDIGSVGVLLFVLLKGVRDPAIQYSRNLALSALFLLAVFVLLPRIVFGSAYADMRLAPFMIGIALIALRPRPGTGPRSGMVIALVGLAFFLARTAGTTWSYWLYDKSYDRELAALEKLPVGAKLVSFVGETCYNQWTMTRLQHLPGMAMVRRLAYTNDQWSMPGAQMLTVRYAAAQRYAHDASQIVTSTQCPTEWWRPVSISLVRFPRDAFDYVWLISPPNYDKRLEQGLIPLWRDGNSALFRIDHAVPPARLSIDDWGPYREIMIRRRERLKAQGRLPS